MLRSGPLYSVKEGTSLELYWRSCILTSAHKSGSLAGFSLGVIEGTVASVLGKAHLRDTCLLWRFKTTSGVRSGKIDEPGVSAACCSSCTLSLPCEFRRYSVVIFR